MPTGATEGETQVASLARSALDEGLAALARQDVQAAVRWLDRAHRLVPRDPNVTLTFASACLLRDPAKAQVLFTELLATHDIRQGWLGLAAARLRLAGAEMAAEAMATALSRHMFVSDAISLAEQIGQATGWCGLRPDGSLELHPSGSGPIELSLDGTPVHGGVLPAGWRQARALSVSQNDRPLLGSPIQIGVMCRLVGCVAPEAGGIRGWAWHPNDPDTAPDLTLSGPVAPRKIVTQEGAIEIPTLGPLARPRAFYIPRVDFGQTRGVVRITGPDGKDLTGSPLDPFLETATAIDAALPVGLTGATSSGPGDKPLTLDRSRPAGADGRQRGVTVVIPVHNGGTVVQACLTSVLASIPAEARVLVIDDGSTEAAVIAHLDKLADSGLISVRRNSRPLGFPASANAGIRAARGRDVVLLNSDTLVPQRWLERLHAAAYADMDIGTVTPLSNDASILSYPGPAGTNPIPNQAGTDRLDRMALQANGAGIVDIPVGVGFCLYLRRDCLNATGAFRTDVFAQGYGEENDLCLRAGQLGWRNVALTGLFVGHVGGSSFGGSGTHLRQRNSQILETLHPGYHAAINRFLASDPLAQARRRIDLLAWRHRVRRAANSAILITHSDGGGVAQRVAVAAQAHTLAGRRPIVLQPATGPGGAGAIQLHDGIAGDLPNLIYVLPNELPALLKALRATRPVCLEAHHLADYPPEIYDLIRMLDLPYEVHVHDYASVCPRIALVTGDNRYCGGPDLPDCETCIADHGHFLKHDISVAALRQRSAAFMAGAQRVVVPSDDTGHRLKSFLPVVTPVTVPHDDDSHYIPAAPVRVMENRQPSVCVVGAIGVHKGFDVLLACAQDAARRDLDLMFTVVGHTIDDARLMATGHVFVTGQFKPNEAVTMIEAQNAALGFIPSICPETWCLTLGDIWRAGLNAVAFDLGAPAERIKRTGRGIVLPLGLSPNAINNALIAAIRAADR